MNLLLALLLVTQGAAPLRKSDLVRLLSASAMSSVELAQFVGRNCLTFEPTERDRTDFRRLGADRALLDAVDRCARRTTVTPVVAPPRPQPVPARPAVSPVRSAFATGGGQRGPAGSRLPRALVFDARDSLGVPIAGVPIVFVGINARIDPDTATTNASGEVRVGVSLGPRAGPATVLAAAGAVADARIFRVLRVTQDSLAGTLALKPDQPGTTSLAVIANGMRQYFTVTVPPRAAPGKTDCP